MFYDYLEAVKDDVKEYIRNEVNTGDYSDPTKATYTGK